MREIFIQTPNERFIPAQAYMSSLADDVARRVGAKPITIDFTKNPHVPREDWRTFGAYTVRIDDIPIVFGTRSYHPAFPSTGSHSSHFFYARFVPWEYIQYPDGVLHTASAPENVSNYWLGSIGVLRVDSGDVALMKHGIHARYSWPLAYRTFDHLSPNGVLSPSHVYDQDRKKVIDVSRLSQHAPFVVAVLEAFANDRSRVKELRQTRPSQQPTYLESLVA